MLRGRRRSGVVRLEIWGVIDIDAVFFESAPAEGEAAASDAAGSAAAIRTALGWTTGTDGRDIVEWSLAGRRTNSSHGHGQYGTMVEGRGKV